MKNGCIRAIIVAVVILVCSPRIRAEVYRVGPGEKYARISDVAEKLEPGDVVEVTGDLKDTVRLAKHGTFDKPITIRGVTRIERGRIVRPKLTRSERNYIMTCAGNWTIIDGLEFSGVTGAKRPPITGIHHGSDNLVVRNCYFHHLDRKAIQGSSVAGSILVEFCEFDSNGGGTKYHTIDLFSRTPGAVTRVEHCWFHDGTGGNFLKSHASRNVIRYNWFESPMYSSISIFDMLSDAAEQAKMLDSSLYPMHTDIVGNVFFQGWSPGTRYATMRLGGEHETAPGTEGDFHIAHNLFISTRATPGLAPDDETVHLRVLGNIDRLRLYNNIFLEYGVTGAAVYSRGRTWAASPRTLAFRKRRGHGEPIVEGANNWISTKALAIPESFKDTLRGINPVFVDLVNFDFRPRKDSPLVGAGLWPLPKGQIIDLAPEYEPQRGIPVDLKPKPRRKATPPSIGPFEVAE